MKCTEWNKKGHSQKIEKETVNGLLFYIEYPALQSERGGR